MLSLAVLDEAATTAQREPVLGTIGLRAALAALWWLGDQTDREPFDSFWKIVTGKEDLPGGTPNTVNVMRRTGATTQMHGICRQLGFEYSVWVSHTIGDMRQPPDSDRRVTEATKAMMKFGEESFLESIETRRERDQSKRHRNFPTP